jgi:hypothetical protein
MAVDEEAARELAGRLRQLRDAGFPDVRVKQSQLRIAFGVSEALISSWERLSAPVTPPESHLLRYSRFFATPRSLNDGHPRLLADDELTGDEHERRQAIEDELIGLRFSALGLAPLAGTDPNVNHLRASDGATPWRFPAGEPITMVSARLPAEMLADLPSSDRFDPDYVESYRYADLDSVIELHGHIRAVNPDSLVKIRVPEDLVDDDRSAHLVLLGGVDWNQMTRQLIGRIGVPVRQARRRAATDHGAFETLDTHERFEPFFDDAGSLTDDVAHFVRAPNPFNRERTLTICNALYALGVYGVVRALTDAQFRDRNAQFLAGRFAEEKTFSILCHVPILAGAIKVPDWTEAENRPLHEWPEADR